MWFKPSYFLSGKGVRAYSAIVLVFRRGFHRIGVLDWLNNRKNKHRVYHWITSWFAFGNLDALVELDVPWWTYDAIDSVDEFLRQKEMRVFEYGSGASTVWLAKRAKSLLSVEHDRCWLEEVKQKLDSANHSCSVELVCIPPEDNSEKAEKYGSERNGFAGLSFENYARKINETDQNFDLIVIDGRARQACLSEAIGKLAEGGIILFDNSRRPRYKSALENSGLEIRRLKGTTPTLLYPDETALMSFPAPT